MKNIIIITIQNCLDIIPEGFYLNDSLYKTIDKCDIKCQTCSGESMSYNICVTCNSKEGYYPKSNDSSNFNNFINCYKNPENYFLNNNIYNQCFSTCKNCNQSGDINNNNCTECFPNYFLIGSNCYEKCPYYYYFDSSNIYHCT